jgi:hypothetical protein
MVFSYKVLILANYFGEYIFKILTSVPVQKPTSTLCTWITFIVHSKALKVYIVTYVVLILGGLKYTIFHYNNLNIYGI